MGSYSVRWKHSAAKELRGLDRDVIARILRTVDELAHDPCPSGSRKLRGSDRTYRLRVGDYRIVYSVLADALVVEIIRVGHRREVYRRLT
jgi:mRNA interferase RelE/StbE